MAYFPGDGQMPKPLTFSDDAWLDVLSAVDRTYADLIEYQERLERQNAELQAMRGFLTSILGSVSDVLIVVARTGEVEQVSQSLADLTGHGLEQLSGSDVATLFDPSDRDCLHHAMEEARASRRSAVVELRLVTPSGVEPIDLSIAPRLDDRGRAEGYVLTGRPLGTLRKAYAELQAGHDALKSAQAQLVRNEKLASLGRLLAGVAHELNNPISFVYANTHALERYAGKFEQYFTRVQEGADREELVALRATLRLDREVTNLRTAIEGARDGAERVRDIVEDLRRLSSEGSGDRVMFDLVETSRVAANWVLRGMKTPVTLRFEGVEEAFAFGRPGHVQQIVMNLVQNAVDALGGREDGTIVMRHDLDADRAILTVMDNGPGVPPEVAVSIFDPFFTTKPVGKGTGLGLSISHKIAEEHGGRLVLCDDAPGGCFRLELPVGEDG
ncbi:sensor histidine kinase [Fuscovulum ytuae]|uniref:histidine kinase n=1 Tax=Fuscovulum ytuae TaxID=3042299 RepID=A0ABY8QEH8_9RHOB|nr:ATP-binding protein [Fuscovulum sp. YMD61]WGV18426.1 histidine kinase dimerization/phospho-acceptor domain-containing protein [Fuscovulum sp. YMD61]